MRIVGLLLCILFAGCGDAERPATPRTPEVATFSIAAFDPETGDLGVAVQSRVFGVGVVVPWVRADVGAVATQALANPRYGPDGLEMLDDGVGAEEVVKRLTSADRGRERRQLGVVDAKGRAASFTGKQTFAWAGHHVGEHYCCQGNILAGKAVVDEMAKAFEREQGPLAERLVEALRAGQKAGGDKRGRQSAALLVARRHGGYLGANDRYIDIRVDDHETPIEELARLLKKRRQFGRDARVPRTVDGLIRESRTPVRIERTPEESRMEVSARSVWERWKQLRRARDYEAIWQLTTQHYRDEHALSDLRKAEEEPETPQARAEKAIYIGTRLPAPSAKGKSEHARLYFDDSRSKTPIMVLLVKEDGRWRIIP